MDGRDTARIVGLSITGIFLVMMSLAALTISNEVPPDLRGSISAIAPAVVVR